MYNTNQQSMLVVDTPKNCYHCKLPSACRNFTGKNPDYNLVDRRPDWCPLKPAPKETVSVSVYEYIRNHKICKYVLNRYKQLKYHLYHKCPYCGSILKSQMFDTKIEHLVYKCSKCNSIYY